MRTRMFATLVAAGAFVLGFTALSGTAQAATGSTWDRLAQCESGGNWSINTGNGFSGGLQFTPSTWRAFGGTAYAPYAYRASRGAQIAVAQRVLAAQGWGAWPACSAKLGLRGTVASGSTSGWRRAPRVSRSTTRKPLVTKTYRAPAPRSAPKVVVRAAPAVASAGANYVVRSGDYLSKIAARHGVRGGWQAIYALNRAQIGSDPNFIFPGQRLRLS